SVFFPLLPCSYGFPPSPLSLKPPFLLLCSHIVHLLPVVCFSRGSQLGDLPFVSIPPPSTVVENMTTRCSLIPIRETNRSLNCFSSNPEALELTNRAYQGKAKAVSYCHLRSPQP